MENGDSFYEVTHRSWGARIGNSFVGTGPGLIAVLGSLVLLWLNEGWSVETARSLDEGAGAVVAVKAASVDPANAGKLVHVSGTAKFGGILRDDLFGVSAEGALMLRRHTEMYQWQETQTTETRNKVGGGEETITRYDYATTWGNGVADSASFRRPGGHENPARPFRDNTLLARDAKLGAFAVPPALIREMGNGEVLPATGLTLSADAAHYQAHGEWLYEQPPANPQVGDMRVQFRVLGAQPVTVVAQQANGTFVPYQTNAGGQINLVKMGLLTPGQVFKSAHDDNVTMTWILRAVGLAVMAIGFSLLFGVFKALAMALPFFGNMVGAATFLVSLILSLTLSTLTIAVAWIAVRPLFALGVLGGGALLVAGLYVLKRR